MVRTALGRGHRKMSLFARICTGRERLAQHFPLSLSLSLGPQPAGRGRHSQCSLSSADPLWRGRHSHSLKCTSAVHKVFLNRHTSCPLSLSSLPDSSHRPCWTVPHLPDLTVSYVRAKTSLTARHSDTGLCKMLRTCLLHEERADAAASPASPVCQTLFGDIGGREGGDPVALGPSASVVASMSPNAGL